MPSIGLQPPYPSVPQALRRTDFLLAVRPLAIFCIAASLIARVAVGIGQPLWLDEAWTGAIAGQSDFEHLIQQVYLDVNAPIFYVLMYGWVKLFGMSNFVLRLPSLLFGSAAALLIVVSYIPKMSSDVRWVWAALLATWFPGVWESQDARCYGLLLLVCTAQTIVFVRLLSVPTLRAASCWTACSAVAVLTHYDAIFITACQGLIYVAMCREQALRTWPAALIFGPVFGWLAYHFPRIVQFADPAVAWYNPLSLSDTDQVFRYLFGTLAVPCWLAIVGLLAIHVRIRKRVEAAAPERTISLELWMGVAAAIAAASMIIILGFLRPTLALRYLVPVVPGIMLGVVLAARPILTYWKACYPTLMIACLCSCLMATSQFAGRLRGYSFETAVKDLMNVGVTDLVFTWDHPASAVLEPKQVNALGHFFFDRARYPIHVLPVLLTAGQDPSAQLLNVAKPTGASILWLYDKNVHGTVAASAPPQIDRIDPGWHCRDYGEGDVGIVSCYRPAAESGFTAATPAAG